MRALGLVFALAVVIFAGTGCDSAIGRNNTEATSTRATTTATAK